MSETLQDGGSFSQGGDAGGFGHHHGADAAGFGHHNGHNHGFLNHLFSADGDHSAHGHGHPGGEPGQHAQHGHHHQPNVYSPTPQNIPTWNPLHGLKLQDALQGINVTPNTLLLFLFLAFFGWLYVVYFIRHHEPLNTQVIGTNGAAYSATGHHDRHIVNGVKKAFPVRTSHKTGEIYVPHEGPQVNPSFNGIPVHPDPTQLGAYHLPLHTPGGVRVKTVVNR